jgi:hypothetical protein
MISKVPLSLAFMLGAAISYPVSSGQLLAREEKEERRKGDGFISGDTGLRPIDFQKFNFLRA